jgi:signal transduction histidine kinase
VKQPLDFLGRIKVKLGLVIVLAVGTAFVVNEVGINSGLSRGIRIAVALILALIMVQVLAMGMTKPLRQMARAAQTIAKGRYTLRVRATSRDEVGELARAFNAMAADLGEVDRQRRELVANVSHELRTPITGLRAVLENVVDGVSPADPVTMKTALAQTERLGRLVAQLLDLSRLDSGVRLIEPDAVELAPLLEQAVREAALAREDVRLDPSVPADLVVRADPDLLAQVLANLLDNAVRHSPSGGSVTVTAAPDGDGVRIAVADQGPGIPASAHGRVFERFSRLDTGRTADAGGAGLGLAIVKEIVELHGGSIRIGDCAGCRMIVDLPGRTTMADTPLEPEQAAGAGERVPVGPGPVAAGGGGDDALDGQSDLVASGGGGGLAEVGASRVEEEGEAPVSARPVSPASPAQPDSVALLASLAQPTSSAQSPPSAQPVAAAQPVAVGEPVSSGQPVAVASSAAPMQGVTQPAPMADGRRLARRVAGGVIGLLLGFLVGLFAAVFVSVAVGSDTAALITLVLVTALIGAVGVSLGAGTGRRPAGGLPYQPAQGRPPGQPYEGQLSQGPAFQGQGHLGPQVHGPQSPPPPYVPPPLFPRPDLPETPRWLLPAAAGAGVFSAVALPDAQMGLGVVLVAMVLGAAALPAVLRRITPWTVMFGLTAYWLIAMAAVRDADWLVGILFLAGCGLLALAVSGAGFGWLGVIRGGASVLLALGPVPWFLAKPLKRLTAKRRILPMLTALGITAVLLLVFGLLFASADAVFATYLERLTTTPDWAESVPLRIFLFVVGAVLLAAVVLVALRPVVDPVGPEVKFAVTRTIWLVPLTAVNLLFAAFVAVQITALFGGNAWVLKTAGLTYAEYARQGFFQLVIVSLFVLGIVAVAGGLLRTERRERWLLAGQLGVLCALTMVVLASALHRMDLYTDAYGLSRLRLSVQATVWWLGALFALVMLAGAARLLGRGSGWLPRTIVLVTGLGLGAFAIVNPDLQVAQTQVEVRGVAKLDADYLGDLGAEAVPALDRLPEPQRSCVLADVVAANGLNRADAWNGWNLARSQARELLAKRPVAATPTGCDRPTNRSD